MLQFSNIKKSFSGVEVLHGVSFSIQPGLTTALVGENGAGKSTLMKILSGVYPNYEGSISIDDEKVSYKNPLEAKKAGISIIHQELSCIPDMTVAENIFLGEEPLRKFGFVNYPKLFEESEKILEEFEFPYSPEMMLRNISVGWQQIVEIAHALSSDAKILILDEPTSALTENEIKILFEKIRLLKEKGKIIIFISHRLEEIYDIADEIAVLRDGNFIDKYSADKIASSELISKMVGKTVNESQKAKSFYTNEISLQVSNLKVYDKTKTYLEDISFYLRKGEKLGVAGLLGSGKTELLKFLFGENKLQHEGSIFYNGSNFDPKSADHSIKEHIYYLSKDRKSEGIFSGLDLIQNSSISVLQKFSSWGFVNKNKEKKVVSDQVKTLNVKYKSLYQPIQFLSGGNQQKILIGRGLLNNPKLLLLDEPTRGIDIGAKEEIYNLIDELSSSGISFIISSSHIPELLRICDRILVLFNGIPTAILNTDITYTEEVLHYAFYEEKV